MSKKQNTRANFVLKYLRWRNTDANGDIAAGYLGEVFDQDPTSLLPNIALWVPAAHGQGGHWSLDEVYDWSWRQWLASLTAVQLDAILQGGTVLEIGVGPQNGLPDPLPGMGGPLWDFWVRVSLALAGGQDRIVYLHPGSDGGLRMCDASAEERIASCRRAGRGISAQLHALYPKMRPRLHPQPPQAQQGFEEARAALLGGLGKGAGASGLSLWRRGPSTGAASSSLASVVVPAAAAVAATAPVSSPAPGADVPAAAAAYGYAYPAALVAGAGPVVAGACVPAALDLTGNTDNFFELLNASGDRAMWCGFELQFFNGLPYLYWDRRWWHVRGPSPRTHPYHQATHWWEPYEP